MKSGFMASTWLQRPAYIGLSIKDKIRYQYHLNVRSPNLICSADSSQKHRGPVPLLASCVDTCKREELISLSLDLLQ